MAKSLSQSGITLSDAYDIKGSILGISQVLAEEGIHLTHDLASTLFMERMQAEIFLMASAATLQDTAFAVALNPLTASTARIYGVTVQVDVTSRLTHCNLCARDPLNATEYPLFVWDGTNEDVISMDDGTALADQIVLRPSDFYGKLPVSMYGIDHDRHVNQFRLRGLTSGFGAGTVTVTAQIYAALTDAAGALSSKGVPIPSW